MDELEQGQGYYSVLRWRNDVARDEGKNIAVLLVDPRGEFGAIRAAPISGISPRLHEQGMIDSIVVRLEEQFAGAVKPSLGSLREWSESLRHSLYLTTPKPTAVPDVDLVVAALYKALCAPNPGGSKVPTKGKVLDGVVSRLRRCGRHVARGQYQGDFLFDAVVTRDDQRPAVALDVLSFATAAQRWGPVEHDAGHFLFALERTAIPGVAVVNPPSDASHRNAVESYERVRRWCASADVRVVSPDAVDDAIALLVS